MMAMERGKHLYCEKPMAHSVLEVRRMTDLAKKQNVATQLGVQRHTISNMHRVVELIKARAIGEVTEVHSWIGGSRGMPALPQGKEDIPAHLKWDLWLGQAPQAEYCKERTHGTFRWWFDYSGGPVTDWGAHHNDIARWAIGEDGPVDIEARALTEVIPGGFTTPAQFEATLTWGAGVKQIVRTTPDDTPYGGVVKADGQRNGVKFIGSEGWVRSKA